MGDSSVGAVAQGLGELEVAGEGIADEQVQKIVVVDEGVPGLFEHDDIEKKQVEKVVATDEGISGLFENDGIVNEQAGKDVEAEGEGAEHRCNEEAGKADSGEEGDKACSVNYDYWGSEEQPPLDLNYDALKHVAKYFLPGAHGACIDITTLMRGSWHEIRVLHFEDGWTCIGRFTREAEPLHKTESELATMEYVRKHSKIRVPEIFFVNHNENHAVGAPFVLMERIKGGSLDLIWLGLSLEHKLFVTEQLAKIYGELASLKFDQVGSLKPDGSVGPLIDQLYWWHPLGDEPCTTTEAYMFSYLKEDSPERVEKARSLYPAIKKAISSYLEQNSSDPMLHAPYCLNHTDLSMGNVLATQQDAAQPPKITGVIDWEWSVTTPIYYLYEYPSELFDGYDEPPKRKAENKMLRKRFVSALAHYFPKGSADRKLVRRCFKEKNYTMEYFKDTFIDHDWDPDLEVGAVQRYLQNLQEPDPARRDPPYDDEDGWQPDSQSESEDEV